MSDYAVFTSEMKKTHKILIPDMLPVHFSIISGIFRSYGYDTELLRTSTRAVIDEGLKNVHNDTCYPALLVIGQFIEALKSGRYDPDRTALLITQTGGGCRASNYIHLLRKALKTTFPQVPVISLNFSGMEKQSAFKITPSMFIKLIYAVVYSDLLMSLYNQCKPYEKKEGESDRLKQRWQERLIKCFDAGRFTNSSEIYRNMLDDFAEIPRTDVKKIKVGIVGEIYVKYSPLANNQLEEFLLDEGCEPVVPALLDFCLYCIQNVINDYELYGGSLKNKLIYSVVYRIAYRMQKKLIDNVEKHGVFEPPHDFEKMKADADKYIHKGVKMGEGWLIPAEMAELAETGTLNIVCVQPFGCLPNHIVSKGVARTIKNAYPDANIVAVDYDASSSKVNQENRIKLMIANARK
jgi:predicted nucleotide-binding protein (sugar kinase/HSP70/actin superfamily)